MSIWWWSKFYLRRGFSMILMGMVYLLTGIGTVWGILTMVLGILIWLFGADLKPKDLSPQMYSTIPPARTRGQIIVGILVICLGLLVTLVALAFSTSIWSPDLVTLLGVWVLFTGYDLATLTVK